MKMILDILNRSKLNLIREKENTKTIIDAMVDEIKEHNQTIENINEKLLEVDSALNILTRSGEKDVTTTSKSKKIKSISSNS